MEAVNKRNDQSATKQLKREPSPSRDLSLRDVLEVFVKSGFCTVPMIGRLKRSCKGINNLLGSKDIWAIIYHQFCGKFEIPENALEARGHGWFVKKLYNPRVSTDRPLIQQFPPIEPPPYSQDDFMILFQICQRKEDGNHVELAQCSATGEDLAPLKVDGKVKIMLKEPLIESDAKIHEVVDHGMISLDMKHPNVFDTPGAEVRVNLLRLSDMKMCCLYRNKMVTNGFTFWDPPKVLPLDRDANPRKVEIHELDFNDGWQPGEWSCSFGDVVPTAEDIPSDIIARCSGLNPEFEGFCFDVNLTLGVTPQKTIAVTGVELKLLVSTEDDCEEVHPRYHDGVTPFHLFSYFHYPP